MRMYHALFDKSTIPKHGLRMLALFALLVSAGPLLWGQTYTDTYTNATIGGTYTATNSGSDYRVEVNWDRSYHASWSGGGCDCNAGNASRKTEFWEGSIGGSGTKWWHNNDVADAGQGTGDVLVGPGYNQEWYIYATAEGWNDFGIGCIVDCNTTHHSTNYSTNSSINVRTAPFKNPVNAKASVTESEGSTFSSIKLTWFKGTDMPDSWTNYRIYGPDPVANNYSKIYGVVNGSARTFTVTGLDPDKQYGFIIETISNTSFRPANAQSFGNVSSSGVFAFGRTLGITPTATQGTYSNKIKLSWNSFSSVVDNIRLMRSKPTFEGGGFEEIAILNKHAQSYQDTDVIPGYAYTYQVIPLAPNGDVLQSPEPAATGWMRPNGTIKGRVLSRGGAGVQNVLITVETVSPGLPANKASASTDYNSPYTVLTDVDGYYELRNIYYCDSAKFHIRPSFPDHGFDPTESYRILDLNAKTQNGVDFTDTTAITVGGSVSFLDPALFNASGAGCAVVGAKITINGTDFKIRTKPNGTWSYALSVEGAYDFKVAYLHHAFEQDSFRFFINEDKQDIDFVDIQVDSIRVKVQDACKNPLITVGGGVFYPRIRVQGQVGTGCFDGSYDVDANGLATLVLPASSYSLSMDNSSTNHQVSDGTQKTQLDAISYEFDMRLRDSIQTFSPDTVWTRIPHIVTSNLDPNGNPIIIPGDTSFVVNQDTSIKALDWLADFVYYGPFKVVALWEDAGAEIIKDCHTNNTLFSVGDSVIVIESPATYPLGFEISDLSAGCLVDTGVIKIWDFISDKEKTPFEIPIRNGYAYYGLIPGLPNTLGGGTYPHQKYLYTQVSAGARRDEAHEWWAFVEGVYQLTPSVTTRSPQIPTLVVHDPPGDNSFSWIEKGSSYHSFDNTAYEISGSAGTYSDLIIGSSTLTSYFEATAGIQWKLEWLGGQNTFDKNVYETTVSFSETFSTSADPLFTGNDGDVYFGKATSQEWSVAQVLTYEKDGNGCWTNLDEEPNVSRALDGSFIFTEKHVKNVLIPQLEYLEKLYRLQAANTTNPTEQEELIKEARLFQRDTSNWKMILTEVEKARSIDADYIENISFSAGASYDKLTEDNTTDGHSWVYTDFIDIKTSVGLKVEVKAGVWSDNTGGVAANFRHSFTRDKGHTNTDFFKVGYHLEDKDIGDFFSVNVLSDNTFGVPAFEIFGGTSSCPQEEGTQSRDRAAFNIYPPTRPNIPIGGTGHFVASLGNAGESQEAREYHVRVIPQTNPHGAQIRIGGQLINNGSASFFIDPFQTIDIALTIEQGPLSATYDNIGIMMYPPCEYELWENNGNLINGDTVWISASFQTECTQIALNSPVQGWLVNASSNNQLRFDFAGYDLNNSFFESITLEYKRNGQGWLDGPTLTRDNTWDVIKTYLWDVSSLADGAYSVRARANCGQGKGTTYSTTLSGLIDRNSIGPFGTPTPSDGFLRLGQDISVTFDKDIDCGFTDVIPTYQPVISLTRTDDNTSIPLVVQCSENEDRIILVPTLNLFSMPELQGVPLIASVQGMQDDQGNVQEYAIEWSFVVNASPVYWDADSLNLALAAGRSHVFNSKLKNTSVLGKAFTITDYPSWLTPSTLAGTVLSDGEFDMSFLVSPNLEVGVYRDTVVAMIDGWPEYLDISYEALAVPPGWKVDPGKHTYSMSMVLAFSLDQTDTNLSRDDRDRVAAIYNGEVRGVAQLEYVAQFNKYMAFLTVYSNIPANEEISFSMWRAATGVEHRAAETFYFADEAIYGRIGDPEILHADGIYQVIPLKQGWNWVSLHVTNSDMTIHNLLNSLASPEVGNDIVVKRKDMATATYTQIATPLIYANQWAGTLSQLDNKQAYLIHLSKAADTLRVPGYPITNFDNIDLISGWNWIGYQPQEPKLLNDALSTVNLRNRDLLKSQEAFSEYHKGSATWYGPLQFMEPGKGYKLKLKDGVVYNDLTYSRLGLKDFAVDHTKYESSMTLIGSVGVGEARGEIREERLLVGAFIDDTCRGYGFLEYVEFLDEYRVIFSLNGNSSDIGRPVTFKLYDTHSGQQFIPDNEPEIYITDRILGQMLDPYVLFERLALPEAGYYLEQNYPNPYDSRTTIRFILPQDEQVKLSIYDQFGKRVALPVDDYRAAGEHSVIFDASGLPSGVYHYSIEAGEYRASRKMVKF